MACVGSILCVGEDLDLLNTRAMLLETLGAEVKCATTLIEALEQVADENFDVIVLCHSLNQHAAVAISDAIRERKPPPLILKMTKYFGIEEEQAQFLCDAIVDARPPSLIDCARELLLNSSVSARFQRTELRFDEAIRSSSDS